jgi:uncharacterized protein
MSIKSWVIPFMVLTLTAGNVDPAHEKAVLEYRQRLETSLKSDTGWLTVAGLHWLKPGDTPFGTGPASKFVLPEGKAPAKTGVFVFDGKTVKVRAEAGVPLLVNGKAPSDAPLADDAKKADMVTIGDLTMFVIERGGKVGIRLRDKSSKFRQNFTKRDWYAVKPEYKVNGKFIAYAEAKKLRVPTVIEGVVEEHESPGEIEFALNGKTHRSQVLKAGEGQLWLIFRDQSSGKGTYPAGRFLYGDLHKDGTVTFDFNKAYNPPCAFTDFATCPLPPRQNSLKTRVEAGELDYHIKH